MTWQEKLRLTVLLSLPAMVAQISSVAMQIIDAAMLGHLGTKESATVGLVSTTIWLFGGLCSAFAAGFSVQVAHHVGANDLPGARNVIRQGIISAIIFSTVLMIIGLSIAPFLPHWLGADADICYGATEYFSIVAIALPILITNTLAAGSLRCSGNVKVPSFLNASMCMLDVVLNYILIFIFDMGTKGAALGTLFAYLITMFAMLYFLIKRDNQLRFSLDEMATAIHWKPKKDILMKALKIGSPISLERGVMCGAQIAITSIIAPLGPVAIAANTFGINIESLCYMPGYGISEAATTLVGQSLGAHRHDLMRSFSWLSMTMGMAIMAIMGIIMGVFAPEMMNIVTNDPEVISLGTTVLRIEAWAEPMFAASIVAYGAFVGSGKTLIPSIVNLSSIWIVRLSLAIILAPTLGLVGVWIAMAVELTVRGIAFIIMLRQRGWTINKT
ncbi:MAG: MATE family efflux transporter [Prevotellaceae bacterium]|nr:MATE family efflux transporter [Candidatus Minthosoma equi]